jgi:hypothetical protein
MTNTTQLDEIAAGLVTCFGVPATALGDSELLAETAALERLARIVGARQSQLAAEAAARSRPELGDEGLSRSQNFATPVKLVAAVTGVSSHEARSRIDLGTALRGAQLLGGGVGPQPFPAVLAAMERGDLGTGCAAVITRECANLLRRGVAPEAVSAAEVQLADAATQAALTADDVAHLAVRIRQLLDPDGLEPRAEAQHEARSFTLSRSGDGMYRGRLVLAPEAGAVWLAAVQAIISPRTTPHFVTEDDYVQQAVTADVRTGPQKMADAATELVARASAAPDMPHLAGATTTVSVHVSLADLEAGRGAGWVDGVDEPLSQSAIERLRCHSPVVSTVFGDRGEVLHHGKARRLFSPAQNRALAARDGGCVWPTCDRPPSWCESHHVEEWRSPTHPPGRTDVDNGVLLCHFHHRHVHESAWKLEMRGGVPHVVPPRWVDVSQTPIPVTRRRTLPPPALLPSEAAAPAPPTAPGWSMALLPADAAAPAPPEAAPALPEAAPAPPEAAAAPAEAAAAPPGAAAPAPPEAAAAPPDAAAPAAPEAGAPAPPPPSAPGWSTALLPAEAAAPAPHPRTAPPPQPG